MHECTSCVQMCAESQMLTVISVPQPCRLMLLNEQNMYATLLHRLCGADCGVVGAGIDLSLPGSSTTRIEAPALRIRNEACHVPGARAVETVCMFLDVFSTSDEAEAARGEMGAVPSV